MRPKRPEKAELVAHFANKMGRPAFVAGALMIPRRFTDKGRLIKKPTRSGFVRLSRRQAAFLMAYEKFECNIEKACQDAGVALDWAERFLRSRRKKRLDLDDQQTRMVASIATPEWTKAKMVDGVTGAWQPKNDNVATKCLAMLKDITHPRTLQSVQINQNILNLPAWTPEQEKKIRELADQMAGAREAEIRE